MNFDARNQLYRNHVQEFLHNWYARFENEPQKLLFEAMQYSLLAGGKRLRPILVYEFCRMCGGSWENAAPFAAAIEMIHTYSLIHDDLPCMDNDDYRRGRLTNHKVFGEAIATLAGDALLTDAFSVASTAKIADINRFSLAISILSECAGSLGMVGGQVLDILSCERSCTEEEVIHIQTRKTGALINAACALGVIAGGGSEEQLQAACSFAGSLGIAFQIRDDMLDVIGTKEELGKSTGTDSNKNTFIRIYGLEKCESLVKKYTDSAISQLVAFRDSDHMRCLAEYLTSRRN